MWLFAWQHQAINCNNADSSGIHLIAILTNMSKYILHLEYWIGLDCICLTTTHVLKDVLAVLLLEYV